MLVIAKAYGGEPLERVVTGQARGLSYLLNPSAPDANNPQKFSGVGFPQQAVFVHDIDLLDSLRSAWVSGDRLRLERLWSSATPLPQAAMEAA